MGETSWRLEEVRADAKKLDKDVVRWSIAWDSDRDVPVFACGEGPAAHFDGKTWTLFPDSCPPLHDLKHIAAAFDTKSQQLSRRSAQS